MKSIIATTVHYTKPKNPYVPDSRCFAHLNVPFCLVVALQSLSPCFNKHFRATKRLEQQLSAAPPYFSITILWKGHLVVYSASNEIYLYVVLATNPLLLAVKEAKGSHLTTYDFDPIRLPSIASSRTKCRVRA